MFVIASCRRGDRCLVGCNNSVLILSFGEALRPCCLLLQIGDETGQMTAQMNLTDFRSMLGMLPM